MKSAFVVAGVAVAACAAYLGVAFWGGQKVEKNLRAMSAAAQAEWPMVRVTDERYDRHLLAATHTFTLRTGCDSPDAGASAPQAAITIVQHIRQGPFPGFAGFGAATVDTELAMDAGTREQVAKLFGTGQPFQAHTDVAFSGATHTHFTVAPFHTSSPEGQKLDFQGLTGDVDNSDSAMEYDVRLPSVSVADAASAPAGMHMTLNGTHIHTRAEGAGDWALRPSKSQGEMQSLEFVMAAPDNGILHKVAFSQWKFSQDTSVDKTLMSSVGRAEGVGQIDDTKLDRIAFQSTMKRFDAVAYQGIVRRIMSSDQQTCGKALDPARLLASQEVQAAMLQMLAANPEISLDKLQIDVAGKRAELRYALGVDGFATADAKTPLMAGLMARGYGNLWINLPEEWVQKSMAYAAQQSGPASGTGDQAALAEMMLGKVIDQGYVARDAGMLRSEVVFKNGRATINGKPLGGPPAGAVGSAAATSM